MAFGDLSAVTRTLVNVLREAINHSPWKPAQVVNVTSLPPERLKEVDNVVGLYLYHVTEEAAVKNQPWPGRPATPIRFSPIALNLHYVLSTRSEITEEEGPYREQLLMGLAVKSLHDNPIIDDSTIVAGVQVMQEPNEDTRLRIALRHVPAAEAISYWTAGSNPLRLSAYYEVSVVMLEPDEPDRAGGRVLTYGIETFVGGLPRLSTSRNTITFRLPNTTIDREIEVQPAQAAIDQAVTFIGSGFAGTTLPELFVRGPGWADAVSVGPTWGVSASGDFVFATVRDHADTQAVLPGTYSAHVVVTRGTTPIATNETPFQVTPGITAIGVPDPAGLFSITGGLFAHPTVPALSPVVRASIATTPFTLRTSPGALAAGEMRVASPTQLDLCLPAGLTSGDQLPIRVTINGAESGPKWIAIP